MRSGERGAAAGGEPAVGDLPRPRGRRRRRLPGRNLIATSAF